MSAQRGRDGTPCRPHDDLETVNAELRTLATGWHGVPSLPSDPPPDRKALPHGIPPWVPDDAVFFITINCVPRGNNQLARPSAAKALFDAAIFYEMEDRWRVRLMLLMPDHLHALISFPRDQSMRHTVRTWKKYLATHAGISWQRDFFDHRLRSDESYQEKAYYIRMNPVRAGSVATPDDWDYVLDIERVGRTARSAVPTR